MASDETTGASVAALHSLYPRTTTFLVVRHAESEANAGAYFASQSDSPLTERGRAQAASAAAWLVGAVKVDALYCSDLSRARDTAAPLAKGLGLTMTETPRLRERHMGELTGMTFADAARRFPELWAKMRARDPHAVPPGGESHAALALRAASFVDELHARHRGGTVLIVSHGVTILFLLRHLMGIDDVEQPLWFAVDNASCSRVDVIEISEGVIAPRLAYLNRVAPGAPASPTAAERPRKGAPK